jgi:hypothetical protein
MAIAGRPDVRGPRVALTVAIALLAATACTSLHGPQPAKDASGTGPASPAAADLTPYLATLTELGSSVPDRQAEALAAAEQAARLEPSAAHRLRYALALGAAGHSGSDPVQASQLVAEVLAAGDGLTPAEVELAQAFLREFDARVGLGTENARQREDYEQKMKAAANDDNRRLAALGAENQRLKKSLAEAERKLSAVAEMERSLLENGAQPAPDDTAPPQ